MKRKFLNFITWEYKILYLDFRNIWKDIEEVTRLTYEP